MAKRTGGKLFYPNDLENLQKELLNNETIKPITYSQKSASPLIELGWLIALIIVLLALEWFLRKRHLHI
jgi:hypothetical protein